MGLAWSTSVTILLLVVTSTATELHGNNSSSSSSSSRGSAEVGDIFLRSSSTGATNKDNIDSTVYCRMTILGTIYEVNDTEAGETETHETVCIPIYGDTEDDDLYSIDLPDDILSEYLDQIQEGNLHLAVQNAWVSDDDLKIVTSNSTQYSQFERKSRDSRKLSATANGKLSITVVRILTIDSEPSFTARNMRDRLFGDSIGMKTQYLACSFGQFEVQLSSFGVMDVFVDQSISNFTNGAALVAAANKVIIENWGVASPAQLSDRVMFCVPPGTGSWAASAALHHWKSQYNDEWCLSLTATMHETGHTLGLLHSNEGGRKYADATGYMAAGHRDQLWPRKCFNGYNNWYLGWFESRSVYLDPVADQPMRLKLATFVDYDKTMSDEPVIVNVADAYFLQYNVAKGFNVDTEEKQNTVTVTSLNSGGTELHIGLNDSESFEVADFEKSGKTLVIEACERISGRGDSPDIMVISVALDMSLCPFSNRYNLIPPPSPPTTASVPSPSSNFGSDVYVSYPANVMVPPTPPPTLKPTNSIPAHYATSQPDTPLTVLPETKPGVLAELVKPNTRPEILAPQIPTSNVGSLTEGSGPIRADINSSGDRTGTTGNLGNAVNFKDSIQSSASQKETESLRNTIGTQDNIRPIVTPSIERLHDIQVDKRADGRNSLYTGMRNGMQSLRDISTGMNNSGAKSVPTLQPTIAPTLYPSLPPTLRPTKMPSPKPTPKPTNVPTMKPTPAPTQSPTTPPTPAPTQKPTPKTAPALAALKSPVRNKENAGTLAETLTVSNLATASISSAFEDQDLQPKAELRETDVHPGSTSNIKNKQVLSQKIKLGNAFRQRFPTNESEEKPSAKSKGMA